ncbi:hypothetical protein [Streptomyces sp. NPDC002516]
MSFDDAATGPAPGADPKGSARNVRSGRHKRRRTGALKALGVVTTVGATVAAGLSVVGSAHATNSLSYEIAFQTSGGKLGTIGTDGETDITVPGGLAASSSPSISGLPGPGFGFDVNFRAADGTLSSYDPFNGVLKRGATIAAGTSPSSALATTFGGFNQTFYRSPAGELWRIDGTSPPIRLGDSMAANTGPAVAWNASSGQNKAAIVSSDGFLKQSTNGSHFSSEGVNVPVAGGTSPSVAVSASDSAIAVNGGNGDLTVTRSSDRTVNDTGLAIKAGTSPSITAMTTGGFLTAYVSPDGTLNVLGPTGTNFPLGEKVAANSSPAITADDHGGWEIAYSAASNGALSTYDYVAATNSNHVVHSSTIVKAGTSPAIAAVTPKVAPPVFNIGSNNQQTQFINAIQTPNAIVNIAGNVQLDLSGQDEIPIAPGVQIIGERTSNPKGPRLYTTTFPGELFTIGKHGAADNVRISGIQLDGGQTNPTESAGVSNDADAITVFSSTNVELDHLTLYRWRGTALNIQDPESRINAANAATVWVHDNYIHDNQHPTTDGANPIGSGHGAGYGVNVSEGAYALIERNVFDSNRHSITSDGKPGSGYLAYRNLFLNFGIGSVRDGASFATQQIDVHGRNSDCILLGGPYSCGPAGEYFDLAYNTLTTKTSFASPVHLRGTPTVSMDTENNVFAENSNDAVHVNETGYHDRGGNVFNSTAFNDRGSCDFDGDGKSDPFMATGATWWYASSRLGGNWAYLNQSTKRVADVTLADVNGDGRCDVTVKSGGQQYVTTDAVVRPNTLSGAPVPDVRFGTAANAISQLTAAGYEAVTDNYPDQSCSLPQDSVAAVDQFGIAPVVRQGPKPKVHIQVVQWVFPCQS